MWPLRPLYLSHYNIDNYRLDFQLSFFLFKDNRKVELQAKIEQSRNTVTELTSTIDRMRVSRDIKIADIEKLQEDVQVI